MGLPLSNHRLERIRKWLVTRSISMNEQSRTHLRGYEASSRHISEDNLSELLLKSELTHCRLSLFAF